VKDAGGLRLRFFVGKKVLAMKKKSIRRVDPREPKAHW
tara:strand:+ start:1155 stop:1268 length:114 start_codon:yes stop_codon:yes gene_type:complete